MATIFRTPKKHKDPLTGKQMKILGPDGKPIMSPKWRTVIFDHCGKRKAFTLTPNKRESQVQANMLEAREREIRNGLRPKPCKTTRLFDDVYSEYMTWGRIRGGRGGAPWAAEFAVHKERVLLFWRNVLELERIGDIENSLQAVEIECHKQLSSGNSGKTVSNKVQHLGAMLNWCEQRGYLKNNPLAALGKFDITPTFIRRAMLVEEFKRLMIGCALHRRLLYEVAACSGLRSGELRKLEPKHLDSVAMMLRIDRKVDKGRKERRQPIPEMLAKRLAAFAKTGEAKRLYAESYRNQGKRRDKRKPPENPLLYVPCDPARSLRKDLEAVGIPYETGEGRLDFSALRTAYINFLMELGANIKTTQELARHATAATTLNYYGRTRKDKNREVVEALGVLLQGKPA